DVDEPTLHGERAQVLLDVIAADHVEDDIDAAAGGHLAHHLEEVHDLVVDAASGAEGLAGAALLDGTGGGADLVRAARATELGRGGGDAAGAARGQEGRAGAGAGARG